MMHFGVECNEEYIRGVNAFFAKSLMIFGFWWAKRSQNDPKNSKIICDLAHKRTSKSPTSECNIVRNDESQINQWPVLSVTGQSLNCLFLSFLTGRAKFSYQYENKTWVSLGKV